MSVETVKNDGVDKLTKTERLLNKVMNNTFFKFILYSLYTTNPILEKLYFNYIN